MRKISIAYAVMWLLSFTPVVSAHGQGEGYQMGPGMMWSGHGMGWWMFPFGIIIVILIICFLLLGKRGSKSSWCGSGQEDAETPLDILKKRYAKGEISKEEFEQMKQDVSG